MSKEKTPTTVEINRKKEVKKKIENYIDKFARQEARNVDFSQQRILKLLGQKIKELRLKKGYNQVEFSKKALVEKSYLVDIENGKANITFVKLSLINRVLNGGLLEYLTPLFYDDLLLKRLEEAILYYDLEDLSYIFDEVDRNFNNIVAIEIHGLDREVKGTKDGEFILNDFYTVKRLYNYLKNIDYEVERLFEEVEEIDGKDFEEYRNSREEYTKLVEFVEKNGVEKLKDFFHSEDEENESKDNKNEVE